MIVDPKSLPLSFIWTADIDPLTIGVAVAFDVVMPCGPFKVTVMGG